MNKYLLISLLSVLPFTQAFAAEKDATVKPEFKGTGKITLELATDQTKKIEINSKEPTSTTPVPAGNYNVSISNGAKNCFGPKNTVLEEGKIYKAFSSDSGCDIQEETTALNQ